jgi:hypothetical protein
MALRERAQSASTSGARNQITAINDERDCHLIVIVVDSRLDCIPNELKLTLPAVIQQVDAFVEFRRNAFDYIHHVSALLIIAFANYRYKLTQYIYIRDFNNKQ